MNNMSIHVIRRFPPTNLNRDDLGNPKTMTLEGTVRAVISAACQRFHERAYHWGFDDGGIERTRYQYTKYVYEPLLKAGISEDIAREVMYSIQDVISGRDPSKQFPTRDRESKKRKEISKLEYALGQEKDDGEIEKLKTKIAKANDELGAIVDATPEAEAAALTSKDKRTAEVQALGIERCRFLEERSVPLGQEFVQMRTDHETQRSKSKSKDSEWALSTIADVVKERYKKDAWAREVDRLPPSIGAIFGQKATSDFQPARDGAVHSSFAVSVGAAEIDEDYWSATDKYEPQYGKAGSQGSGHLNVSKYVSAAFYMQSTLDLPGAAKIMRTATTDDRLVEFAQARARFFASGHIGAKVTTTNPAANKSDIIIVEFHDDNPCNLINYKTPPKGEDSVEWFARHAQEKLIKLDKIHCRKVERAILSTIDGVFTSVVADIDELCLWITDRMRSGTPMSKGTGTPTPGARVNGHPVRAAR